MKKVSSEMLEEGIHCFGALSRRSEDMTCPMDNKVTVVSVIERK
jgi:hypothetical protein